jgi:NTE family protein
MEARRVPRIGVAFSGGGMRGLAYVGVLRALEEARVPVDMIAGTSMGGLIGGLYAAGISIQELAAFSKKTGIMDLASPDRKWRGLFGHTKMEKLLGNLLGDPDITFEQLQVPLAVTATDIEKNELVVLDEGPLIPALMATSAFPLVFSPVYHQGRWLVDGGVLNNFPVDVVRYMGANRVLGVSTPSSVQLSLQGRDAKRGLSPRALSFLTQRTRDWKQPFLILEASSALSIRVVTQTRLSLCPPDLLLEIHLPEVGLFTASDNGEVIEAGYKVATAHLAELVALKERPLPPRWLERLGSSVRRLRRVWAILHEPDYPLFPCPPPGQD